MNERIAAIRSLVMRSTGIPDPENQKLRAGALDQTTHKSEVIREAKAIVHYFDNRDLVTNVEPNRSDFVFSRKSSPAFLAWDK